MRICSASGRRRERMPPCGGGTSAGPGCPPRGRPRGPRGAAGRARAPGVAPAIARRASRAPPASRCRRRPPRGSTGSRAPAGRCGSARRAAWSIMQACRPSEGWSGRRVARAFRSATAFGSALRFGRSEGCRGGCGGRILAKPVRLGKKRRRRPRKRAQRRPKSRVDASGRCSAGSRSSAVSADDWRRCASGHRKPRARPSVSVVSVYRSVRRDAT